MDDSVDDTATPLREEMREDLSIRGKITRLPWFSKQAVAKRIMFQTQTTQTTIVALTFMIMFGVTI